MAFSKVLNGSSQIFFGKNQAESLNSWLTKKGEKNCDFVVNLSPNQVSSASNLSPLNYHLGVENSNASGWNSFESTYSMPRVFGKLVDSYSEIIAFPPKHPQNSCPSLESETDTQKERGEEEITINPEFLIEPTGLKIPQDNWLKLLFLICCVITLISSFSVLGARISI